eukprot:CAMPEP_0197070160 /NCGR_PEP_ID=MMETSP1384-20130603/198061_1 /TAXON_ID=29189 /ORGANISM="Ammonia sp." /LENGTH=158 /DNA_ID=CAMNT_0042508451 /DNA_START=1 /DNA_END=477 /DNA_ORIENTATION=+
MTLLTSVSNIGLLINYQITGQIMRWLGIECDEDPNDENRVVCNFHYLWLFIVIVNLSTLLPLVLIKRVPNEKELQKIGDSLNDATSLNLKQLDRKQMIGIFGVCMDYVFPCVRKTLCCCVCKQRQSAQGSAERHSENAIQLSAVQQQNYAEIEEIEMR